MPKARCFERGSAHVSWRLLVGLWLAAASVQAQTPSLLDMVESAKQTKLLEQSKALMDAYKPAPPVSPPAAAAPAMPSGPALAGPVPSVGAPVLRAIYGVNDLIEAEVVFDGQSYSLYSDDARAEIGPWAYGVVFRDGVLLVRKPLNAKQSSLLDSLSDREQERLISCKKLGLAPTHCLFLPASKASTGTMPALRTTSSSTGVLPPLPR